jgi:lipid II isoglutaminyl synthase (glutamine-hydrolysing)
MYNTNAAVAASRRIGIHEDIIRDALKDFQPAFGRQEVIVVDGKKIQLFLSKNPTGFNESLRTIKELGAKSVLFVLNDGIADGRDVSWIWDVDMDIITGHVKRIIVSGDRAYEMGLRIKYAEKFEARNSKFEIEENLEKAIHDALGKVSKDETLYILPTYTAMLEVRKILTGKKIL